MVKSVQEWEDAARIYARVAPRLDARLGDRHRLTLSDLFALRALAQSSLGHMRVQELAVEVGLSASAGSRLITRMEAAGLLRRFICDTDRRGMYTELTHQGRIELAAAEETYAAILQELMEEDSGG